MADLSTTDRENLAYLYELDQFKSFRKLCETKRLRIAAQILGTNAGDSLVIAMLQGQYNALDFLLLEMKKIHKQQSAEN